MAYFTPDRSNRPTADDDPTGGTTEIGANQTKTKELKDGRTAVVEAASVGGVTMIYYYFDMADLTEATTDELQELLERSNIDFQPADEETEVDLSSTKKEDAEGRPIWEFQVSYW